MSNVKRIFCAVVLMSALSLLVTSCDRGGSADSGYAASAEGSYVGKFNVKIGEMEVPVPQLVKISKVSSDVVDMSIRDFEISIPSMPKVNMGDLKFSGVQVQSLDNGKTIIIMPTTQKMAIPNMGEHEVKIIKGEISGNNLKFDMEVMIPLMPIKISFNGNR